MGCEQGFCWEAGALFPGDGQCLVAREGPWGPQVVLSRTSDQKSRWLQVLLSWSAVFQQAVAKRSAERKVFLQGLSLGQAMGLGTQGSTGGPHIAQGV